MKKLTLKQLTTRQINVLILAITALIVVGLGAAAAISTEQVINHYAAEARRNAEDLRQGAKELIFRENSVMTQDGIALIRPNIDDLPKWGQLAARETMKTFAITQYCIFAFVISMVIALGALAVYLNNLRGRLRESLTREEQQSEKMRQFVSDASHELRTPLVSLKGFAELYRIGAVKGKDAVGQTFEKIENGANRMNTLVESLLSLARLDDSPHSPSRSDFDLRALAEEIAAQLQVQAQNAIHVDCESAVFQVNADLEALGQIMTNLVSNSMRYAPESDITIALARQMTGSKTADKTGGKNADAFKNVVSVIDHGPGVEASERELIFERFYRVDDSRNRETAGGSGLGLSIVKQLCVSNQIDVRADETPGGGLTVSLTF